MEQKIIEGYVLSDSITIKGETFVLGHYPEAPAPYVTWAEGANGGYYWGHYFTNEQDARIDLFKRGMECLLVEEHDQLIQESITDSMRADIAQEDRENTALIDIESCLYDAMDHLGFDMTEDNSVFSALMKDEQFQDRAKHLYYQIDHSAENEALTDSLETLLNDKYADLLPKETSAVLKISPEEMDMINDILSKTEAEVEAAYGAFEPGENVLIFSKVIRNQNLGEVDFSVAIYPSRSEQEENSVQIEVADLNSPGRKLKAGCTLHNVFNLEQVYSIEDWSGHTWNLDLHADERFRRIGREYEFQTDATDGIYQDHNHQKCTVQRQLTKDENDILYGVMWKAQFEDGVVLDVFDDELHHPMERDIDIQLNPMQQKPVQSVPLEEKITDAVDQVNAQSMSPGKEPIPEH